MRRYFAFLLSLAAVCLLAASMTLAGDSGRTKSKTTRKDQPQQQTQGQHSRMVQARQNHNNTTTGQQGQSKARTDKATLDGIRRSLEDALKRGGSPAKPVTGEQIHWSVVSSGGGTGTSTNYILGGTLGQTATGPGSSTNFMINQGFWQNFGSGGGGCCIGITGNIDGDPGEIVDIGDLTALIGYLFIPPNTPPVCMEEGNVDGDTGGIVDIGDLTALIGYLFIPPNTPPAACQ